MSLMLLIAWIPEVRRLCLAEEWDSKDSLKEKQGIRPGKTALWQRPTAPKFLTESPRSIINRKGGTS